MFILMSEKGTASSIIVHCVYRVPGTVLGTGETVVTGSVPAFTTGNLLSSQQAKAGTPWPGAEAPCFTGSPGAEPTLFQNSAR